MTYAFDHMDADAVLQIDADLSHDPRLHQNFCVLLIADMIFVCREADTIKGGSIPENWGMHRKIYSVLGNSIVRFGLGISR